MLRPGGGVQRPRSRPETSLYPDTLLYPGWQLPGRSRLVLALAPLGGFPVSASDRSLAARSGDAATASGVRRRSRVARRQAVRAARRDRRGRAARWSVLVAALAAIVVADVPGPAPSVACPRTAVGVVLELDLADDGEVRATRQRQLGADGTTCVDETDDRAAAVDRSGVQVGITYRDAAGRSLEAAELGRVDGPATARIAVRDRSAQIRTLSVEGPQGDVEVERRVGLPRMVHIEVRLPGDWQLEPATDAPFAVRVESAATVISHSGLVFVPFTDGALELEFTARPGRGRPEVAVSSTLLAGPDAYVVPDALLDRDTAAVLGAINAVSARESGQLIDAVGQLADGAGELADGVEELADGAAEAADGLGALADGTADLAGGTTALADGLGEVTAGGRDLADGTSELAAGTAELAAGAGALAAGAQDVAAGARLLADELSGLGGAEMAADAAADPRLLIDAVAEVDAGVRTLAAELAAARDQLAPLVPEGTDPTDPTDPAAPLAGAVAALDGAAGGAAALAAGTGELVGGVDAAITGLTDGIEEAAAALTALADGTEELAVGTAAIADGVADLRDGLVAVAGGADELAAGTGGLADGLAEVRDGATELADGSVALADGSREAADGIAALADGTRALEDGAGQLADGTRTLAEEAEALPEALEETVGIADRGVRRAALADAMVDDGVQRASDELGDAVSLSATLVAAGSEPLPTSVLAAALAVLVLGVGLGALVGRRSGRARLKVAPRQEVAP